MFEERNKMKIIMEQYSSACRLNNRIATYRHIHYTKNEEIFNEKLHFLWSDLSGGFQKKNCVTHKKKIPALVIAIANAGTASAYL